MDKLFDAVLAVSFALFLAVTIPVSACSNGGDIMTGAACSIDEINAKLQQSEKPKERNIERGKLSCESAVKVERNLRPIKQIQKGNKDIECQIGLCLTKQLFKN